MVYDKKRSGDPDFDDKVPLEQQLGETVKGPKGEDILVTEAAGPVLPDGSHATLDEKDVPQDNRPAPGHVAKEASDVQIFDASDVKNRTAIKSDAGKSNR